MPEYTVEITIHETGHIRVEAENVKDALEGVRSGRIGWPVFDQTEAPRVGVRRAWLADRQG